MEKLMLQSARAAAASLNENADIDSSAEPKARVKTIDITLRDVNAPTKSRSTLFELSESDVKVFSLIRANTAVVLVSKKPSDLAGALRKEKNCTVTEVYEESAERYHPETFQFQGNFSGKNFDTIVFLDWLQYAADATRLLKQAQELLSSEGSIIVVVPNAGHATIRLALLQGEHFVSEQLIPPSTRATFTKNTLLALLTGAGLIDVSIHRLKTKTLDAGLEQTLREELGELCSNVVDTEPESDTSKFIVEVIPVKNSRYATLLEKRRAELEDEVAALNSERNRLAGEMKRVAEELAFWKTAETDLLVMRADMLRLTAEVKEVHERVTHHAANFGAPSLGGNSPYIQLESRVSHNEYVLSEFRDNIAALCARIDRYTNIGPIRAARSIRRKLFRF